MVRVMKATKKKTTIRAISMPDDMYRVTQEKAEKQGLNFSCYIRQLIRKEIESGTK